MSFVGLTWDHPRGYDALAEAARRVNAPLAEPLISWEKQPLEGFESAPLADLAARYDLLVVDHPHMGEAVAENCLIPLQDLFPEAQIAAWQAESVGPSLSSYVWDKRIWALPLDVACQVMARRADLVDAPSSWEEVITIAEHHPVALSLAGPHAVLTLMSMAAGAGYWAENDDFLPDEAADAALQTMHRLYDLRPAGSEQLNPIGLLDTMASGNDLALIPLIFGYVTYAREAYAAHLLTFSDSLRSAAKTAAGGALGGTGIAFSRRCQPSPQLLEYVADLMRPATQTGLFAKFGGQPSSRTAWSDAAVNADTGNFYAQTRQSAESAFLRPRFDGFIAFQSAASARLRQALVTNENTQKTVSAIRALWQQARALARGDLDDDRGMDQ
ncbi:MAG: carbohydrate ABC transporter substrate-binding protein [Stappiaceae bacterium]